VNLWDTLIQGFVLALIWLYKAMGSSEWALVLSIAILTIAVRLLTLPLTLPSQRAMRKSSQRMQSLQPELDKLKKKYRNDPQKLQQAQLELYQTHGINPLSSMTGCLPMFIQLPIIWAFYQSISRALADQPGEMLVLSRYLSVVPGFMSLVPLARDWLWVNLARPDAIILPILVAGSTWLQQKLTMSSTQTANTDPQAQQMSQSMMITMPRLQTNGFSPRSPTPRVTTNRIYPSRISLASVVSTMARTSWSLSIGMTRRIALADSYSLRTWASSSKIFPP